MCVRLALAVDLTRLKMHPTLKTVISLLVLLVLLALNVIKFIFNPFFKAIFSPRTALTLRTPDSRFSGLDKYGYTFSPNYVDLPLGGGITLPRMHYVCLLYTSPSPRD